MVITIGIVILTAIIMYIIVFLSSMTPMRKLKEKSLIDAINNNTDEARISKTKKLKLTEKLFKQEGVLAARNIEKSKLKYKSITASISITIILFFIISEFAGGYINQDSNFKEYKILLGEYSDTKSKEILTNLKNKELIEDYVRVSWTIINSNLTSERISNLILENTQNLSSLRIVTLEGREYDKFLEELGISKLENNKCILLDTVGVNSGKRKRGTDLKVGEKIVVQNISSNNQEQNTEISEEEHEIIDETDKLLGNIVTNERIESNENIINKEKKKYELEIVAISQKDWGNMTEMDPSIYTPVVLIVNKETFEDIITEPIFNGDCIYLDTSYTDELDNIFNSEDNRMKANTMNLYKESESGKNRGLTEQILAYSFMLIVTMLSGVNIFNIIYSSFALRIKEIATLKSIGMSDKQINKMLNLEGIFYGLKAILIGIAIGIVILYLIYLSTKISALETFEIPVIRSIIAIALIYLIIFLAINKGKRKINIDNIIEKVKNENI